MNIITITDDTDPGSIKIDGKFKYSSWNNSPPCNAYSEEGRKLTLEEATEKYKRLHDDVKVAGAYSDTGRPLTTTGVEERDKAVENLRDPNYIKLKPTIWQRIKLWWHLKVENYIYNRNLAAYTHDIDRRHDQIDRVVKNSGIDSAKATKDLIAQLDCLINTPGLVKTVKGPQDN